MTPFIIAILLTGFMVGLSKAFADITSDIEIWNTSILSNYQADSFFGPKDETWVRKDHDNKIINWLLHGPLVWVTDIWHFANAFNIIFIILSFIVFYYANGNINVLLLIALFYSARQLAFNAFYHKILLK
jgi:hypothetical protein